MLGCIATLIGAAAQAQSAPPAASTPNPGLPTLFIVGDSTARNNTSGAQGWGDPFASYFDPTKINILNRAMAGRSSRTFITEGRWDSVIKEMKAGDLVLLQLGHNDGGPVDSGRGRASLPGLGDDTREITRADGTKETVQTYGWYLRKIITETKAKGATPILLSLTVRNIWKEGKIERGSGNYRELIAQLARTQNVAFVDVTNIIANEYERMGPEAVKALFGPDYVHTSPAGADRNAASVVAGLKALPNSPFMSWLSQKGKAVEAAASNMVTSAITPATPASTSPVTANLSAQRSLPIPANPALPSLFLIGDSTVRNGQGDGGNGQWGWGEPLAAYFDRKKINIVNRAVGGLSSRTYFTGFWNDTKAMIKAGDIVMMQFGHNDSSAVNDPSRARGTLRGAGEETQAIDNLLTKQPEVVHTYGWYLRQFVVDIKARGAIPIVCSPIPRKSYADGMIKRNADSYGGWAKEIAVKENVPFLNLNEIIAEQYDELGPEEVEKLFADPYTHTNMAGAELNAASVIAGLKALPNNPLAPYFGAKAAAVQPSAHNGL